MKTDSGNRLSRGQLATKALVRFAAGFIFLLGMLLMPAGTVAYWEAWTYIAVIFVPMAPLLIYLLKNDPELLERRLKLKEKEPQQSRIVKLGLVCYVLAFLLPGFDRRFGWSHVPVGAVVVANVFVLLGYGLFILALRENRYASRVVEVVPGQHVVTTGPYALVRHPMYLGGLVIFFSTPVALGSWWALLPALPMAGILVARIRNEERLLAKELAGYQAYAQTTKYRLLPGVW